MFLLPTTRESITDLSPDWALARIAYRTYWHALRFDAIQRFWFDDWRRRGDQRFPVVGWGWVRPILPLDDGLNFPRQTFASTWQVSIIAQTF
jgi:hypothetical protein